MSKRRINGRMVEIHDSNTHAVITKLHRKGDPTFDRSYRRVVVLMALGVAALVALAIVAAWLTLH
jgi:hypothetical protein